MSSSGSTRCFCNLPACISTGYMCKSPSGGCFSDLNHYAAPQSVYHARHGCLELLTDKEEKEWCRRHPNGNPHAVRRKNSHPRSLLYCCNHDMCNHADDPQTKDLINDTTLSDFFHEENRLLEGQWDSGHNSNADVWFKAATIAVPICGAVILFVLIALAIRLLRTESCQNDDYKLGCAYSPSYDKKSSDNRDHFHTSQRLLQHHNHSLTPIIVKKDTNVINSRNFFDAAAYGLLPQSQQICDVHGGYSYKFNSTQEKNLKEGFIDKSDK